MAKDKPVSNQAEVGMVETIDSSDTNVKQQIKDKDRFKNQPSPLYEEVLGAVAAGAGTSEQVAWAKEKLEK